MTSTKFVKYYAEKTGVSKAKAKEAMNILEAVLVSYLKEAESGDKVKVADVTYKIVTVPERSGVDHLHGTGEWVVPEHDAVRVSVSKDIKAAVAF